MADPQYPMPAGNIGPPPTGGAPGESHPISDMSESAATEKSEPSDE